jgi:gas vesicle protein
MTTAVAGRYVAMLFLAREIAHRIHLKTRSFAEHMALNDFYHEIVENADAFAESYQGCYDELLNIPMLSNEYRGDIVKVLEQIKQWIEANREAITPRSNTALHNLIDEAVDTFDTALYKLRFLK